MTQGMLSVAQRVAAAGTQIVPSTAASGFPYINSRSESQVAGAIALDTIAAHAGEVNAVVVAAFGDPGLGAAHKLFGLSVMGMTEAAMLSACIWASASRS